MPWNELVHPANFKSINRKRERIFIIENFHSLKILWSRLCAKTSFSFCCAF
jgi:hypothetical protein